jgi:hypothetical protein
MVISKSTKPKPTIKNVMILIVSMCVWLFAVMSWNKFIIEMLSNDVLENYYSQEEINKQNLYLILTKHETKVSNGDIISQIEHEQFRVKIFKWSFIPRVFLGLCWFFWLVFYLKKFDLSP